MLYRTFQDAGPFQHTGHVKLISGKKYLPAFWKQNWMIMTTVFLENMNGNRLFLGHPNAYLRTKSLWSVDSYGMHFWPSFAKYFLTKLLLLYFAYYNTVEHFLAMMHLVSEENIVCHALTPALEILLSASEIGNVVFCGNLPNWSSLCSQESFEKRNIVCLSSDIKRSRLVEVFWHAFLLALQVTKCRGVEKRLLFCFFLTTAAADAAHFPHLFALFVQPLFSLYRSHRRCRAPNEAYPCGDLSLP